MKFNPLIPDWIVSDLERSLSFYCDLLLFEILYQREQDRFVMLGNEGVQLMLIQRNGEWEPGPLEYPLGRGVSFEIACSPRWYDPMLALLTQRNYPLFQSPPRNTYQVSGKPLVQEEFLMQDPDGYLLRFVREN